MIENSGIDYYSYSATKRSRLWLSLGGTVTTIVMCTVTAPSSSLPKISTENSMTNRFPIANYITKPQSISDGDDPYAPVEGFAMEADFPNGDDFIRALKKNQEYLLQGLPRLSGISDEMSPPDDDWLS